MKWMPFRSPPTAHVAPLTSADRAGELAALHATAFARPWEADEFERMLCERGHIAHALMLGTVIGGFVLSRQVLDEAEILTIVLVRPPAARPEPPAPPRAPRRPGGCRRAPGPSRGR